MDESPSVEAWSFSCFVRNILKKYDHKKVRPVSKGKIDSKTYAFDFINFKIVHLTLYHPKSYQMYVFF